MKKTIPFEEMRRRCRDALNKHGVLASTVSDYQRSLKPLLDYMEARNIKIYSRDLGEEFMSTLKYDTTMTCSARQYVNKAIKLLNSLLDDGESPLIRPGRIAYEYAEAFKDSILEYLKTMEAKGLTKDTLGRHRYVLSRFSVRMALEGVTPSSLTRKNVSEFIAGEKSTQWPQIVATIKYYCRYLCKEGITACSFDDFNELFKRFRYTRPKKLISYYNPEEIAKVESSIDRNTEIGKRDYAMLLLASRLGLRASDVCSLKFSNIDWDKSEIQLVQYKTKKALTLPLIKEVGEAIIDYTKNSRPHSDSSCVFVSHVFPYDRVDQHTYYRLVSDYMHKAEVFDKDRKHGPHSLRHSLATNLLNKGEGLPVISGILGHSNTESTKYYLTVSVTNLLKCAHEVPMIDDSFYYQGGGLFYDYD